MMPNPIRKSLKLFMVLMVAALLSVAGAGEVLSYPYHMEIGNPPPDLSAQSVQIGYSKNADVSGWLVPGQPNYGVMLLIHGVRADRRMMIDRARFLNHLGYTVLLIDLPNHGLSTGDQISYGIHESEGVTAALNYLSAKYPAEKIGVIGVSLGAASFVMSKPEKTPSAVVLESMFPDIERAVDNRVNFYVGSLGEVLSPILLTQVPMRLGVSVSQISPINSIKQMHIPVLIASGAIDRYTPISETQQIFDAANSPKQLWIVEGAAHVDLNRFAPAEYKAKVTKFLDQYMHS